MLDVLLFKGLRSTSTLEEFNLAIACLGMVVALFGALGIGVSVTCLDGPISTQVCATFGGILTGTGLLLVIQSVLERE